MQRTSIPGDQDQDPIILRLQFGRFPLWVPSPKVKARVFRRGPFGIRQDWQSAASTARFQVIIHLERLVRFFQLMHDARNRLDHRDRIV